MFSNIRKVRQRLNKIVKIEILQHFAKVVKASSVSSLSRIYQSFLGYWFLSGPSESLCWFRFLDVSKFVPFYWWQLASFRRSVNQGAAQKTAHEKIKKKHGERKRSRERLWANFTKGRSGIPRSGIPPDWLILTDFVNTRTLLTQMRYTILRQSETFQRVTRCSNLNWNLPLATLQFLFFRPLFSALRPD